jgi:predicted O-methyltransferase YrrM
VWTRVEESVGRIIDLLADRTGEVQAAVIEFGGFLGIGTRKIAIEWSALRLVGAGKQTIVILDVTRDELRLAPEYKPHEPTVVSRVTD